MILNVFNQWHVFDAQDNVPAAADLATGGAEVAEFVHVGRIGVVVGRGAGAESFSRAFPRLAYRCVRRASVGPATRRTLTPPTQILFIPFFVYVI